MFGAVVSAGFVVCCFLHRQKIRSPLDPGQPWRNRVQITERSGTTTGCLNTLWHCTLRLSFTLLDPDTGKHFMDPKLVSLTVRFSSLVPDVFDISRWQSDTGLFWIFLIDVTPIKLSSFIVLAIYALFHKLPPVKNDRSLSLHQR